jgi:hypothetical protein
MPFKRAGWLQQETANWHSQSQSKVSMPFKRAGWLQRAIGDSVSRLEPEGFNAL